MNKKTFVFLGAIAAAGSILAAPGGFRGGGHGGPRGPGGPRGGACAPVRHMGGGPAPRMGGGGGPRMGGPAPRMGGGIRHGGPGGFCAPAPHGPPPAVGGFRGPGFHRPPPVVGGFRGPGFHRPPPVVGGFHAPFRHGPCGFRYPRGYHIGSRHLAIVPPVVLINDYYWTEEVFINGQYFILYCYPDGTKRFADGTIYCYI